MDEYKPSQREIEAGGHAINDLLQQLGIDGEENGDCRPPSTQEILASAVLKAAAKTAILAAPYDQ